jgi:hypothetical protein
MNPGDVIFMCGVLRWRREHAAVAICSGCTGRHGVRAGDEQRDSFSALV